MRVVVIAVLCSLAWGSASAQVANDANRRQAFQHYRNGQELLQGEQFEKAAAEFQQAIELDSLLTLAHYGLGQSYMGLRRFASAVMAFTGCRDAYERIFGMRQQDTVASNRRMDDEIRELKDTVTAARAGRFKDGASDTQIVRLEARIDDLERLRNPSAGRFQVPAEVSLALGSAHFRNGSLPDAEREWLAAVAVNPKLGEAHNNLAAIYAMTKRKKLGLDAVKAAERAGLRVNPQLKTDLNRLPNEP
jgi:tetratricopeptide (TPR) repeat protein